MIRTRMIRIALLLSVIPSIPSAAAAEPQESTLVPGLIGRYFCEAVGGDAMCIRIDPAVAFDWSDGMPDDRLPDGKFKATWEGVLRVPYAGKYTFSARSQGDVRIWIGQRQAFPSPANAPETTFSLEPGEYPIRALYDAPAEKARIHLVWASDSFAAEVISPRYLAHQAEAEKPVAEELLYERGREIAERYGCGRCHPITGVDRMRKYGLPMPHVAHMNPEWVARWVHNPQAVRPGTRMGAPGGTPEEIDGLANSILTLVQLCDSYGLIDSRWRCGQERDPLDDIDTTELARDGRRRFYELGCSACHAPETPDLVDPTRGPSLADIGSKWNKAYLRQLMLDPVGRHPTGGMPAYKLDSIDIDRSVVYMATFKLPSTPGDSTPPGWPAPPKVDLLPGQTIFDPDVLTAAKAPIRKRLCYACHSPENTPVDGPPLPPATARWSAGCLRSDRATSIAPQFTMPPADRAAVIAFLSRRPERPSTVASGELAQRVIERTMYCFACHQRNGGGGEPLQKTLTRYRDGQPLAKLAPITPPDLSGVGLRIGRPWMLETLAGNSPSNRPWLSVKMPSYGLSETDRNRIALRLAAADDIPDLASPGQITVSKEFEAMAPVLIGPHGFNCVNCHFLGTSTYQANNSAPDLALATRRVSRAWFHRWLSSPSRILPSTPMPAFVKPVPGIAGDDLTVQKEIIWRYLQRQAAGNGK